MSYRIIIEDENGLHQAILNETEEAKEVIHNINNILKMSDLTDYIYMFDLKNADCADEFSKEFSKEFQNNILDLFEMCYENHTDTCTVTFEYNNAVMEIDFTFRAKKRLDDK